MQVQRRMQSIDCNNCSSSSTPQSRKNSNHSYWRSGSFPVSSSSSSSSQSSQNQLFNNVQNTIQSESEQNGNEDNIDFNNHNTNNNINSNNHHKNAENIYLKLNDGQRKEMSIHSEDQDVPMSICSNESNNGIEKEVEEEEEDDDDDENGLTIDDEEEEDNDDQDMLNTNKPEYNQQYSTATKGREFRKHENNHSSDSAEDKTKRSSTSSRKTRILQKGEIPHLSPPKRNNEANQNQENTTIPLSLVLSPSNGSISSDSSTSPFATFSPTRQSPEPFSPGKLPPIRNLIEIAEQKHQQQENEYYKKQRQRHSLPHSYSPQPFSSFTASSTSSRPIHQKYHEQSFPIQSPRSFKTSPRRLNEEQRSQRYFRPYPSPRSSPSSALSPSMTPFSEESWEEPQTPPSTPEIQQGNRYNHKRHRSEPNLTVLEYPRSHHKQYPPLDKTRNSNRYNIQQEHSYRGRPSATTSSTITGFSPRKRRGIRSQSISVGAEQLRGQFTRQQLLEALAKHKVGGDRTKRNPKSSGSGDGTRNDEK